MTVAFADLASSDSANKHVVMDSTTPQSPRGMVDNGGSLYTSRTEITASLGGSYDRKPGHPTQDSVNDSKAAKQWPATPRKSAVSSDKYVPSGHLPLTPAQTPTRGTKRSYSSESEDNTTTPCSKRRFAQALRSPSNSPFRTDSIPKFSILYNQQVAERTEISALELKRASESILSQVDWNEVEENVASNRRGPTFRRAIKAILQERVDELYEDESSCSMLE